MTDWLLITIAALGALAWAACFATLLAVAAIEAHWRAQSVARLVPIPGQTDLAIYGNDVMDLTSSGLRSI